MVRCDSAAFDKVYSDRLWGDMGGGSGGGSDFRSVVGPAGALAIMEKLTRELDLDAWLDAPCGAATWQREFVRNVTKWRPELRFVGVDVVKTVIDAAIEQYSAEEPRMTFGVADLSDAGTVLPRVKQLERSKTAALLSRDALQHLSYRAIANAFKVYCGTDVDWLLLGSYVARGLNHDIGRDRVKGCNFGSFFAVNLRAPPFLMGEPHQILREYDYNSDNERGPKKKPIRPWQNKHLFLYNRTEVCSPDGGMAHYAKCFGVTI